MLSTLRGWKEYKNVIGVVKIVGNSTMEIIEFLAIDISVKYILYLFFPPWNFKIKKIDSFPLQKFVPIFI